MALWNAAIESFAGISICCPLGAHALLAAVGCLDCANNFHLVTICLGWKGVPRELPDLPVPGR